MPTPRRTPPPGMSSTALGSDYDDEDLEFMKAIEAYKRRTGIRYPPWTEILRIAKALGYRKVGKESIASVA